MKARCWLSCALAVTGSTLLSASAASVASTEASVTSDRDPVRGTQVAVQQTAPPLRLMGGGEDCEGDVVPNGRVGFEDLMVLLVQWGDCPAPEGRDCIADLDEDGQVGFTDLLTVLDSWGECD